MDRGSWHCTGDRDHDQIANIRWIIKKQESSKKHLFLDVSIFFIDYAKAFDSEDHNKWENSERGGNTRPPDEPLGKPVCRSGNKS